MDSSFVESSSRRGQDVVAEDGGSGLAFARRYRDIETLQFRHENAGLCAHCRGDARELIVAVRGLLLKDTDVTFTAKDVDSAVGGVPDHLVAALGGLETGDGRASLGVQHN